MEFVIVVVIVKVVFVVVVIVAFVDNLDVVIFVFAVRVSSCVISTNSLAL